MHHPQETTLGSRLLRASPIIFGVSLLTLFLGEFGWFSTFETTILDTWFRLMKPRDVQEIVIVEITDEDYETLFQSVSPLDPQTVHNLINGIAKAHPKVIGVDLDTSSQSFESFSIESEWPPVIWAVDTTQIPDTEVLIPGKVLGKAFAQGGGRTGFALLPQDHDGLFRRYRRYFPGASRDDEPFDSFPWAIVKAYSSTLASKDSGEAECILNFSGDRYAFKRIRASYVMQLADTPGWQQNGPLRDKICLVGGVYRAARDEYPTPLGPMDGVQLMAHSVATDLRGGGIHHANEFVMIVLEILGGYLLVILYHRFRLGTALMLSLFAIPVFALLASYVAFSSLGLWANSVPLFAAVLIHQLYDHAREYQKMYEELMPR